MAKQSKAKTKRSRTAAKAAPARRTRRADRPAARWVTEEGRRLLVMENRRTRVVLWPEMGGAITSYVDRETGLDIIWRNPWVQPARPRVLDQPMTGGSDLFDVMDGSWYVSLPTGFFPTSYFGAPIGSHGEIRAVPWVPEVKTAGGALVVTLVGRSVRTPLVYRRELTMRPDDRLLYWRETVENRSAGALPVAWLQHPTFGGPLIEGARLVAPARGVRIFDTDHPEALQLRAGYRGEWPLVPERESGRMRDCSVVPPAGSGLDHSVQLTDLSAGWGCIWNEARGLGFAMEWDLEVFPYAWSWASAGGIAHYPLWGEGHLVTLQPSTSPAGQFADLVRAGEVRQIPGRGSVTAAMVTGFVTKSAGPWAGGKPAS
ncbi:MAG: hypothetical protein JNG83_09455 [Opitutaceae bacterium]|nr:hypothetical protein [Opitutaceae bacterium]